METLPILTAFDSNWDAELGMSESSLATRLPCLCPLVCIQVSVQCVGTQMCPPVTTSTNEIFLQISFYFPLCCPISTSCCPLFLQSRSHNWFSGHRSWSCFCPSDWACLCHCPTAQVCVIFGDKLQGVSKKWWSGLKCHWNGVSSLHSACLELKDTDEQQNLCASSKCA